MALISIPSISLLTTFILSLTSYLQINQQQGSKFPNFDDELRPLTWGQINFLHTTDTHAWYLGHLNQRQYSADWGDFISFTHHMKQLASNEGIDLLLIDTGDKHDGNGLGDATSMNGEYSSKIFAMQQDYDLLALGNHELYVPEITRHEFYNVVPLFGDRYISTNVEFISDEDGAVVPFGQKYRVFHTPQQKLKILALSFLFGFNASSNPNAKVTPIAELIHMQWFNDLLTEQKEQDEKLDMIVVIGHIPVARDWQETQVLFQYLRSHFPTTPIQLFGGHSHIRDFVQFDDISYGIQSGRYCETVGWLSIDDVKQIGQVDRKYIDFNVHSFMYHSNTSIANDDFNTARGLKTSQTLQKMATELDLNTVYGLVPQNYLLTAASPNEPNSLFNLLSTKILTKIIPASSVDSASDSRIIIINTGSIRYDLYKGAFTKSTRYIVSPFENKWKYVPNVPKHIALRVSAILNNEDYILTELQNVKKGLQDPLLLRLPREEKYYSSSSLTGSSSSISSMSSSKEKLSYGYVTHDDFGSDGDDTIHRAFPYHKEPNVIQTFEMSHESGNGDSDTPVDVVFYDFIEPHIRFALAELQYTDYKIAMYNNASDKYNVGQLLQDYAVENWND